MIFTNAPNFEKPILKDNALHWTNLPDQSGDEAVIRKASNPFSETGGLKLLKGNIGRSVIKISAVPLENHIIEAPALIFNSQDISHFISGLIFINKLF